jgi:hypothetical protein
MSEGISIREFARRAGCDEKVVRRKVKTLHIQPLSDGTLDPAYLTVDWRKGDRLAADLAGNIAGTADGESALDAVDRIIGSKGRVMWSKAQAEQVKENYAALLRQLEYDRESALVVEIEDVALAVASEYALVRNKLQNIGSRIAPRVAVLRSAEEIKAIVDAEIAAALNELTTDVSGETDFGKLRQSLSVRFGPSADEAAPGEARGA